MLNKQELFDFVVTSVIEQGVPSIHPQQRKCMYRCNGLKCAAGFLIPDELYTEDIETKPTRFLVNILGRERLKLIQELQEAHDNAAHSYHFIEEFKKSTANTQFRYKQ